MHDLIIVASIVITIMVIIFTIFALLPVNPVCWKIIQLLKQEDGWELDEPNSLIKKTPNGEIKVHESGVIYIKTVDKYVNFPLRFNESFRVYMAASDLINNKQKERHEKLTRTVQNILTGGGT